MQPTDNQSQAALPHAVAPEPAPFLDRVDPRHRVLAVRVFWFFCGGFVSFALNAGPFALLRKHLPDNAAYLVSLTFTTVFFFFWNYFVNFRTSAAWHACARRYLTAVAIMYALNYALTTKVGFAMFPKLKYLVIAVVPFLLSGIKFALYNFWAFPHKPLAPEEKVG
jgi:hypothetical protein